MQDESATAVLTALLTEVTNNHTCTVDLLEDGTVFGCVDSTDVTYLEECEDGSRLSAPPDAEYEFASAVASHGRTPITLATHPDPSLKGRAIKRKCPRATARSRRSPVSDELEIDPDVSYVQVTLGTELVSSSLQGSAFLSTGPAEFLLSLAWGEPFTYEGDAFSFNHLVLSAPIDAAGTNGSYTVPATQDFALVLQGRREGALYVIEFDPTVSSGGTFNVASASWDYDYTQSGSGTAIDVHLEGQLQAVSVP